MAKGKPQDLVHKEFAKEFVRNGMNSSKAMRVIRPNLTPESSKVAGARLLTKDNVQRHIRDLLPSDDVEAGIIKSAFSAKRAEDISWKDIRGFVETSLKLKGYLSTEQKGSNVNVAFIMNSDGESPRIENKDS